MAKAVFTDLILKSEAFIKLKADIKSASIKQSYLFVNRDKTANKILANLFSANALFEENGGDLDEITDSVFSSSHADVAFFGRSDKGVVTVDEIDEIVRSVYFRPSKGNKRFFIIENGETMNPSCQNKLLKTLEEPPKTSHIIILSSNLNAMLSTVVSRCERIEPSPLSTQGILEELQTQYPLNQSLEVAAAASGGNIDAALKLVDGKRGLTLFGIVMDVLDGLTSSKGVLNASFKMTGIKEMVNDFIDFNELIFRDLMMMHEGKEELCQLKMFEDRLCHLKGMFSRNAVINILPLFIRARERLKFYGNQNSIADELFFCMAQIKAAG